MEVVVGLNVSVWRKRASGIQCGARRLMSRGWTKLTWVGRLAAAGVVVLLAGGGLGFAGKASGLSLARLAGGVAVTAGFLTVLVSAVIGIVIELWKLHRRVRSLGAARVVSAVTLYVGALVFLALFPVIAAALATSGLIGVKAIYTATGGGTQGFGNYWLGIIILWCPSAVLGLVVIFPQILHMKKVSWGPERVLPAWLAGFAAVLTWLFVFVLYFNGLHPQGGAAALAVGGVFAAVLLAPFYQFLARSCWQRGTAKVFDPREWWSSWSKAYQEVRLAFPRLESAEKPPQTADPRAAPGPSSPATGVLPHDQNRLVP